MHGRCVGLNLFLLAVRIVIGMETKQLVYVVIMLGSMQWPSQSFRFWYVYFFLSSSWEWFTLLFAKLKSAWVDTLDHNRAWMLWHLSCQSKPPPSSPARDMESNLSDTLSHPWLPGRPFHQPVPSPWEKASYKHNWNLPYGSLIITPEHPWILRDLSHQTSPCPLWVVTQITMWSLLVLKGPVYDAPEHPWNLQPLRNAVLGTVLHDLRLWPGKAFSTLSPSLWPMLSIASVPWCFSPLASTGTGFIYPCTFSWLSRASSMLWSLHEVDTWRRPKAASFKSWYSGNAKWLKRCRLTARQRIQHSGTLNMLMAQTRRTRIHTAVLFY